MATTKKIELEIAFDEENIPEEITWLANEDMPDSVDLKSLFIAGWEENSKSTASFNIWTKEMRVDEMQQLYIQSLLTLSRGFEQATGDKQIVQKMKQFCESLSDEQDAK